jgi:hypothetical protein
MRERKMQITIDLPDWLVQDYEAKTGTRFDESVVETAACAYYMRLYDPMYNDNLPEKTLVSLYGDDSPSHLGIPLCGVVHT